MADEQQPLMSADEMAAFVAARSGEPAPVIEAAAAEAVVDEAATTEEAPAEETEETPGDEEAKAEGDAEEQPEEKEEAPGAKRFAELARQERKIQRQRDALKADQAKVARAEKVERFFGELDAAFKENEIDAIVKYLKIPEERLAEKLIARLESKPSPKAKDDDRLARLEKQLNDDRAERVRANQERNDADLAKQNLSFVTTELDKDSGERWELVKLFVDDASGRTGHEELVLLANQWLQQNPGKRLDLPRLADAFEQKLEKQEKDRLARISKSKKLGVSVPPNPAGKATKPATAQANSGARTLTSKVSSAPPRVPQDKPKPKSREEMIAEMVDGFQPGRQA